MTGSLEKRMFRDEIFTAQVATKLGTFFFHVASDSPDEVMALLEQRSEYRELRGITRVDIYLGELFARFNGQKPIRRYSQLVSA